jgi:hypothetical protein
MSQETGFYKEIDGIDTQELNSPFYSLYSTLPCVFCHRNERLLERIHWDQHRGNVSKGVFLVEARSHSCEVWREFHIVYHSKRNEPISVSLIMGTRSWSQLNYPWLLQNRTCTRWSYHRRRHRRHDLRHYRWHDPRSRPP